MGRERDRHQERYTHVESDRLMQWWWQLDSKRQICSEISERDRIYLSRTDKWSGLVERVLVVDGFSAGTVIGTAWLIGV